MRHHDSFGDVPLDGGVERLVEIALRLPSQRRQLARVEGIAAVVSRAVFDELDQRFRFAELLADAAGDVDVLDLVAARDVVCLAGLALRDEKINRGTVIFDINPIAHVADRRRRAAAVCFPAHW